MKKKIFILLIGLLFILTGCANSNNVSTETSSVENVSTETPSVEKEDFSFQSGLKFGMTKAEFAKHEEECDAKLGSLFPFFDSETTEGASDVPFANSKYEAYASFDNDSLSSVVYRRQMPTSGSSDYFSNKAVLQSKYGTSIASGTNYTRLPSLGNTAIDLYQSNLLERMMSSGDRWGLKIEDMAQFLVPIKDGYANVFCLLYSYSSRSSGGGTYDSYVDVYSYSFVPEEAYKEMVEKNEEQQNEKQQKRQNDL